MSSFFLDLIREATRAIASKAFAMAIQHLAKRTKHKGKGPNP